MLCIMVEAVGFEPTCFLGNRFTVCRFQPLTHTSITWYRERELNSWPTPYQDAALPLSYLGEIWRFQGVTIPFFMRDRHMCVHEHFETLFGAPGETRTPRILLLRQTRLPITSPGLFIIFPRIGVRLCVTIWTNNSKIT